jgi:hypothetical protein
MDLEFIVVGVIFVLAAVIVTWRVMIICRNAAKKKDPCCSCGCGNKFKIPGKK